MITPPDTVWSTESRHLGQRVHVYERLDSTNTQALSLCRDPGQHGVVLVAREQTAGRGQYGRSWQAPPGSSVLMTVLLFPPASLCRPALLTVWAAVSACETIRHLVGLEATIKWPNDVLIRGKKVCGILIEQRTTGNTEFPLATAVGIGLNLTQSAEMFEQASLPLAGSLQSLSGIALTHEDSAKALIGQLDEGYHSLMNEDAQPLEALWKAHLGLVGKRVAVEGVSQFHHGQLLDVTLTGVVLETGPGEIVQLAPEAIRHLDEA